MALTKCYYCGESNQLLLAGVKNSKNLKLVRGKGEVERNVHNRVFDMTPCSKCADWMKQGIVLIGISDEKSEPGWHQKPPGASDRWMPNPYRSGHFAVVKEEAFTKVFNPESEAAKFGIKNRWMFIEVKAGAMIGLWEEKEVANDNESAAS